MRKWVRGCFDRVFARRPESFCFGDPPQEVCLRLMPDFQDLTEQEKTLQARMGLVARPCLSVVDEETAAIITPERRARLGAENADPKDGSGDKSR